MKRSVITIDEDLCTGCGECITGCPEGALQIIDGVARLVSDIRCDGLGACIGTCPEDAITIEEREAEPYDERLVVESIIPQGAATLRAHLDHLKDHGQTEELRIALAVLQEKGVPVPPTTKNDDAPMPCGCPGSAARAFDEPCDTPTGASAPGGPQPSRLTHWPVQLHLISPNAPYYQGKDLLLSADCVAYAMGGFHEDLLKGRSLAIACPKLDTGQEIYQEKLRQLIDDAKINTLTVAIMEVPCCSGLLRLAKEAQAQASRKVPIRALQIGVRGNVLSDTWL